MTLEVDLRATVGTFTVEAEFTAQPGEVLAVLGPNGSGKSTLLGAIAGHLRSVEGRVALAGRELDARMPPEARRIGLLGQRALLFPHLSALENVAFGPRAQGVPRASARDAARVLLDEVGMAEFAERRPAQLSGGQQQRVALARALAAAPDALLLDEPFAALDARTAMQARRLIAAVRERHGVPMILVTHDPLDAVMLAERTIVLENGRIAQEGPTAEVLGHPRSAFVAAVAGVNLLEGVADAGGLLRAEGVSWSGAGDRLRAGARGSVAFSPASVRVSPAASVGGAPNRWSGEVAHLEPSAGGIRMFTSEHPDIAVDVPSATAATLGVRPGLALSFSIAVDDVSMSAAAPPSPVERAKGDETQ